MNDQITKTDRRHLSIKINGMNCHACADRIQKVLLSEEGVISATVNLRNTEAVVEFEDGRINRDSLESAIESLGYRVVR
ncbi:MAG: heavy-metal-associated domain-containing protein [Candidatus Thorarchaeota archaeon]|jgi:Cu+-exporting ATPase